jgi:hypothetical protein
VKDASKYTQSDFLALLATPTVATYESVFASLQRVTAEPLEWEAPGDDAEYITELRIGAMKNPGHAVITFSKYGNLAFVYLPMNPVIAASRLHEVLDECGWTVVPPDTAEMVLYQATKETVHDRFFHYV